LFDEVMQRLIDRIDSSALVEIAERLAAAPNGRCDRSSCPPR
jgi:hypothetical protein